MEKEKIELPQKEIPYKVVLIDGLAVEIKPYLSAKEQIILATNYLKIRFEEHAVDGFTIDVIGSELNLCWVSLTFALMLR